MSNQYPKDLKYTKEHEWARSEGELVRIGITAHAVSQLGEITLVDLPKVGSRIEAGKSFGTVESVKAVSDLYAPLSGEVVEVNEALFEHPEFVNEDPYGKGWLLLVRLESWLDDLMDAQAYERYVASLE
ncbi:MAG: glycine cleavage system protein GcvH [Deltaproteobacteria bacterium]|nr:glycine cleavage system protein GcvH [Sandaracinaceae bacterium]MCX7808146.1 glycine cleavage system protein GcvH [Deltaproteobacteria bacterium]MDW8245249.1 glycine cleavage system protein GcvH [Sandaracinaceae bacterium]